jgi:hypothetical protein
LNTALFSSLNTSTGTYKVRVETLDSPGSISNELDFPIYINLPNCGNILRPTITKEEVLDNTVFTPTTTEATKPLQIRVYPNPVSSILYAEITNNKEEATEIITEVYDITGKLVLSKMEELKEKIEIDTKGFYKGIYFLHLTIGKIQTTQKFIVQY